MRISRSCKNTNAETRSSGNEPKSSSPSRGSGTRPRRRLPNCETNAWCSSCRASGSSRTNSRRCTRFVRTAWTLCSARQLNVSLFPQMITLGGNAELELYDSADPFSEGILFSVMPPKKSWKNISNLSGGEKTLSSLALVFALHTYKVRVLGMALEVAKGLTISSEDSRHQSTCSTRSTPPSISGMSPSSPTTSRLDALNRRSSSSSPCVTSVRYLSSSPRQC